MDHDEEPAEEPEVSEEARRLMQEKAEALEHEAHKIGLHATAITLGTSIDPATGRSGKLVLMAQFAIGDLAFHDRVQDPQQDAVQDEFAKIEHDYTVEKIEELRDRMRGSDGPSTEDPDPGEANPAEA